MQLLSALVYLVGTSILTHLLSRRLSSNVSLRQSSWPRICILIIFIDSYLFLFTAGVLILGAGVDGDPVNCTRISYLCLVFYGSSKVFVYLFLAERIYIVWQPFPSAKRTQSKIYVTCLFVCLLGYSVVLAFCIRDTTSIFTDTGVCKIVLKKSSALALLIFDLFINILLTTLFVWPLFRFNFRDKRIKKLGTRTLWAALIALTTSTINMLVAATMDGVQPSWICVGSCGIDVVVNAIVLFWVTDTMSSDLEVGSTFTAPRFRHPVLTIGDSQSPPAASASVVDSKIDNSDLEGDMTLSGNISRPSPNPVEDEHGVTNFQVQIRITRELTVRESIIEEA